MKLLDLFCGAGGAAVGYHRAGFEVVGVDIKPQKHYPFEFHQADAFDYLREHGHEFDVIHASPPCQAFTAMNGMWNKKNHPDLLTPIRDAIKSTGLPYVIENVIGAPLIQPFVLCGTMFCLGTSTHKLLRHRAFEASFYVLIPMFCRHGGPVIGIYGDHARCRRRKGSKYERGTDFPDKEKLSLASDAMGIDWMNWKEISQAIPPAYTEYIGKQLLKQLKRK